MVQKPRRGIPTYSGYGSMADKKSADIIAGRDR